MTLRLTDLADLKFKVGEPDLIRTEKLTYLLGHLLSAEEVTLNAAVAALAAQDAIYLIDKVTEEPVRVEVQDGAVVVTVVV